MFDTARGEVADGDELYEVNFQQKGSWKESDDSRPSSSREYDTGYPSAPIDTTGLAVGGSGEG